MWPITAFLSSLVLTATVRRYLVWRRVLDVPNERSSHSAPTPRGGGVGIVAVFLLIVAWLSVKNGLPNGLAAALIGGGMAVAGIGLLDDHYQISARLRILIHFAAAGWALWWLHGVGPLQVGAYNWDFGWFGQAVALVGLVWMTNLYNFMDGIDGIAAVESVCVSGLGALMLTWVGLGGLATGALVLMGASAGFLLWNWQPAKIFMGDVGSGFLGFVFGVLAIASTRERPLLIWPWVILLSVFVVDSTLTLLRRFMTGARWYEAHRSHAYQHAARRWSSHSRVTLAIATVNIVWLFPLALGACVWPAAGLLLAVLALVPLVCAALHYGAGQGAPITQGVCPKTKIAVPADMAKSQSA